MTDPHETAMKLAAEAELLRLEGRDEAAREKLAEAASEEEAAAAVTTEDRPRTHGILRISAVSLWLQAGQPARAVALATRYLGEPLGPGFARELDELRAECANAARAASRLPVVTPDFVARAREQEERLVRLELGSGPIVAWRPAA